MSSFSRQQLEAWLKTIEVKTDRVIDLGGSQNPVKGRTKSWDVKEYKILDLEQPHKCKQKPDFEIDLNTDFYHPKNDAISNEDFNIAFCLEVMEYIYDPFSALRSINLILKKGGILYISFHFVYPIHNPSEQDYLRYTPNGARKLLENSGFEIEEIRPRFEDGYLEPETENSLYNLSLMGWFKRQGMRQAKDYDFHDWQGCLIKAYKK